MKHKLFTLLALAGTIACGAFALTACDLFGNGSDSGNGDIDNIFEGGTAESNGLMFYFNKNIDTYSVSFNKDSSYTNEIVIPKIYNGKFVTSIDDYAFRYCSGLTSIIIPDSVTSIGDEAFNGCGGLTTIEVPDSVAYLGKLVFSDCPIENATIPSVAAYAVGNEVEANQNLKSVKITSGKEIGVFAFYGCSQLKNVTISESVTCVYDSAFGSCPIENASIPTSAIPAIAKETLKSVNITSGEVIGVAAFKGCNKLTNITISDSVTSIGIGAFQNTAFYNNESNWENDVLYIRKHLIEARNDIPESYSIKEGTLTIANFAFENCGGLKSITIPDSVTSIGNSAFYLCDGLTEVNYSGTMEE